MIFGKRQVFNIIYFTFLRNLMFFQFFLLCLDENEIFFDNLKNLVEETYTSNGNVPVTLIVHSMGGPMSLVFLQKQTAEWKHKYISRLISLCGAWAGSAKAIKVFAMGIYLLIII